MAYPPGAMRQPGPSQPPPTPATAPPPPNRPQSLQPQPLTNATFDNPVVTQEFPPPPPQDTWPCGCHYPGEHNTDCMWSLWEQMRDNHLQTKKLMGQFMSQVDKLQSGDKSNQCQCPPGCHGKDLSEAMGVQQMLGVTVPWLKPAGMNPPPLVSQVPGGAPVGDYMSESRQQMEEQRRIRNTWAQFLNIFDMALDLANDVSKDRCEAMRRRKERERLERQERREQERRERQERREKCAEERRSSKDKEEGEAKDKKQKEVPQKESKTDKKGKGDDIEPKESQTKRKSNVSVKSEPPQQSEPQKEEPTPEAEAPQESPDPVPVEETTTEEQPPQEQPAEEQPPEEQAQG